MNAVQPAHPSLDVLCREQLAGKLSKGSYFADYRHILRESPATGDTAIRMGACISQSLQEG